MRRLVAIALVAGSAVSSQAQRVAPIGARAQFVSVDSAMAPRPSMPNHIALSPPSASTATIDNGRQGSRWKWVALGALVGAVVGGSVVATQVSDAAEYAVPLGAVLGGLGGGVVGALAFGLSHREPTTSAP